METKLKTIEFDEEFLRQKSVDVDLSNDEYKKDIEKLKKYCSNRNSKKNDILKKYKSRYE